MPDYGFISQPNIPNVASTIGGIANAANAMQQYRLTNIELQKQEQLNKDRIALQQFQSDPNNWQTNGQIDMAKINATVPKIAPLAGPQFINNMTALSTAQTQANDAKLKFGTEERNIVSGVYGVLGRAGVTNPAEVKKALEMTKAAYPDNQVLGQYIDGSVKSLNMMGEGQHPNLPKTLITQSQSMLSPAQQQAVFSPTASLVSRGGMLSETVTQPTVGGLPPSISMTGREAPMTLSPGEKESFGIDPTTHTPYRVVKNAEGQIISTSPVGGGAPEQPQSAQPSEQQLEPFAHVTRHMFQTPQELAQNNEFAKETMGARDVSNKAPLTINTIDKVMDMVKSDASFGPGSGTWNQAMGVLNNFTGGRLGESANNYQAANAYLDRLALQLAQGMGQSTVMGTQMSAAATGSTAMNKNALLEKMRYIRAMTEGANAYRVALDRAVGSNNQNIQDKGNFDRAWNQAFDVDMFRIRHDWQTGNTQDIQEIMKQHPAHYWIQKQKEMDQLLPGYFDLSK